MPTPKVALLTAGGFAPCLSSAVGGLIERYTELAPEVEIIGYLDGYQGLLQGDSLAVTPEVRASAGVLHAYGGSPHRQQPRQADQRRRLREARPGQGGRGPARRSRPSS